MFTEFYQIVFLSSENQKTTLLQHSSAFDVILKQILSLYSNNFILCLLDD